MKPTVDWERVQKGVEREKGRMIWRPYGLPDIVDPERSAFTDQPITQLWDVPEKVALSAAISGALFTERQNPNQPLRPETILEEALAAARAGASCIHIHVRDDKGYNTLSADRFRAVVKPLREEFPDVVVDGCLVPAIEGEWEQMQEVLDEGLLDGVPINTAATYLGDALFAKPAPLVIEKTRRVIEAGGKPIISCYSDGDIGNADRWLYKTGLVEEGAMWLLLPSLPGCSPMNNPRQMMDGLLRLTDAIRVVDPKAQITVCAAGRASSYLTTAAALLGINIRVGMEDTIWKHPHRPDLIDSNEEVVRHAIDTVRLLGREPMTFAEFREMANMPAVPKA